MKITARTLSGRICDVQIEGPVLKKITAHKEDILDLPWIAPGLVDIQVNGFAGIDFNRPLASDEAWRHATQQLYAGGCTGLSPRSSGSRSSTSSAISLTPKHGLSSQDEAGFSG